jgi:hypothetical protein
MRWEGQLVGSRKKNYILNAYREAHWKMPLGRHGMCKWEDNIKICCEQIIVRM